MKIFGKELFNFKKQPGVLYDFAQHGLLSNRNEPLDYISSDLVLQTLSKKKPKKKKVKEEVFITPKGLYKLNALNENDFTIKADSEYLAQNIADIKEKLEFFGKKPKVKKNRWGDLISEMAEAGGVRYGREELDSILERLQNRVKLDEFKKTWEQYPHTSSRLVSEVLSQHKNLRCHKADEFVPDFPKEAMQAMKIYDEMCIKLCNKKAVFYVIADSKDFEKKNQRRDPILLAQSPFGFFWQILGAWDEEMIYLGDL